ncbi:MAG: DinB family protein [Vicinamibacterales bacterium]
MATIPPATPPTHPVRVAGLVASFLGANDRLIALLQTVDDTTAVQPRDGGWSAAQIGSHVAMTNLRIARVLVEAEAVATPEGFAEDWARLTIPARIDAPRSLEPSIDTTRAAAIDQLQASREAVVRAIRGLSAERASACVPSRFGTMSFYQMAEFITRHVDRHIGQAQRTVAWLMAEGGMRS